MINTIYESLRQCIRENTTEFFLFESPYNNYQPKPPDGFFAMRSEKRRIFIRLTAGQAADAEVVKKLIENHEYIEETRIDIP